MDTQPFIVGPLPPGVAAPTTTAQRATYRQALDLEGVFTQHLVDAMMQSAQGDDDSDQIPGGAEYQEMANQQVNTALINGGGLGLAGALYSQLSTESSSAATVATSAATTAAGGADPSTASTVTAAATDPTAGDAP
jgi:Rod binding domain-containing protein